MRFFRRISAAFSRPVFVSYSRKDGLFATELCKILHDAGFRIWKDDRSIRWGQEWPDRIVGALRFALAVIVLLSANSIKSEWVRMELEHALRKRKRLFVIALEEVELPPELSVLNKFQFFKWPKGNSDQDLQNELRKRLRPLQWFDLARVLAVVLALSLGGAMLRHQRITEEPIRYCEVLVESEVLPVTILVDNESRGVLTPEFHRKTLDRLREGRHLFVAVQDKRRAEKTEYLRCDQSPWIIHFSNEEMKPPQ